MVVGCETTRYVALAKNQSGSRTPPAMGIVALGDTLHHQSCARCGAHSEAQRSQQTIYKCPRRNRRSDCERGDHQLSGHLSLPARRGSPLGDFFSAPWTERFSARPTTTLSQALCGLVLAVIYQEDRRNLRPIYHLCGDLAVLGSLGHCGLPLSWVSATRRCPVPTEAAQTSPLRVLALLERWP